MLKVKILIVTALLVPLNLAAVISRDTHKSPPQNRRIESIKNLTRVDKFFDAYYTQNDFFDGLYNKNGKKHDLGADYGLTSDVYRKPNPFYTKQVTGDDSEPEGMKFWYPVYINNIAKNNSVTQDVTDAGSISTEVSFNPLPAGYDAKSNSYSYSYGPPPAPSATYLPLPSPMPTYGPPSYPPSYSYVPHSSYGPPSYYPSTASSHAVSSHEDKKSHESWFLEKLLKKFDLVLMSKMLLKFIIFKKIVKFIAIICILLFLPALKKKFEDVAEDVSSEEERKGRNYKFLDAYANTDFRIKEIANFALSAIEGFESHQIPWCVGESEFYCRFQYMLDQIDLRYPLFKIPGIWFPALTTTPLPAVETTTHKNKKVNFNDFINESSDTSSIEENGENGDNEN